MLGRVLQQREQHVRGSEVGRVVWVSERESRLWEQMGEAGEHGSGGRDKPGQGWTRLSSERGRRKGFGVQRS